MDVLIADRYALVAREGDCLACARVRLAEMDGFHLRSSSTSRRAVDADAEHPFFRAFLDAFASPARDGGYVAVGRHDVGVRHGDVVCRAHCPHAPSASPASVDVPEPDPAGYRARDLAASFGEGRRESDLCNPVTGVLSASLSPDLGSLVTSKVSGFVVQHGDHGAFVRAWGGHCDSYARSAHVGLAEGIERVCCAEPDPEDVLTDVPADVRLVQPGDFGLDPASWRIPHPVITAWTRGVDLVSGAAAALPTRTVHYEARVADPVYVQDSSSGCAVGGDDDEARLFGLLEVVERDAFLLAWHGDLPLREIDADTIRDQESLAYLRRLRLVGRRVRFVDATVGVEVPTVIAVCDTASGGVCLGAGAHPDPERALRSAIVEVASDFTVVEDRAAQRRPELLAMLEDPGLVRAVEDHADLYGLPEARPRLTRWARGDSRSSAGATADDRPPVALADLRRDAGAGEGVASDLRIVVDAAARAGVAPIAVDVSSALSRRHLLACSKVVVPGLLPLDFGWADQRALRMPRLADRCRAWLVEQGLAPTDLRIHPHPHPFP
ncbi:YcaO-like family protein [Clavibacter capsici]|uniref:YcaO-like family protein n=1 Tax=Clavibacter capsici TaxID=1874630 RepID=UPI00293F5242|nr:YcaO-like family protein [Clavibacter capsici]